MVEPERETWIPEGMAPEGMEFDFISQTTKTQQKRNSELNF